MRDLSRLRLGEARRLEAREWREGAGGGGLWLVGVLEGFVGWRGGWESTFAGFFKFGGFSHD